MENKKNVPEIRFKGFTDEWEQCKASDLAHYKKGPFGSALKKEIFVPRNETTVKVYEQQNAINKDWTVERYFITEEYAQKLSGFRVGPGDIIVSCAGTIGEMYELPREAEIGIINQALMRIIVNENVIDKSMFTITFTNIINEFSKAHSNGSAIKNIPPFSDLKPMLVLVPNLFEQKEISSLFSNLDNLITLHQRKCEKLKELKKSMLEKMFPKNGEKTPEVRFKGFTDEWEQCELGDFIIEYKKTTTENNQYPPLTSSRKGLFLQTDYFAGNQIASSDNRGYNIVPYGYFTYRHMSDDEIFYFNINRIVENGIVSTLYPVFTTNEDLDSNYLQYQLNNGWEFKQYAILQKQGGSRTYMYLSKLKKLSLTIPRAGREQEAISRYLVSLDKLITLHHRKLAELNNGGKR